MSGKTKKRVKKSGTKKLSTAGKNGAGEGPVYSMDGKLKKAEPTEMNLQDMYDGEVDFESLVKYEYMKLHRQYRLMEEDRQRLVHQGSAVHKQNRVLQQFQDEREDLLTDLYNVESYHWREIDHLDNRTILSILEQFEAQEEDMAAEIRTLKEMTNNVDKITKSIVDQKLKVQALFGMSLTVPEADRRKRVLEDRLYHHTTKNDTMLSKNKAIRLEINLMLQLRMIYYETLIAIRKQSHACRTKMGEVVEMSTVAYDTRDEAMIKVRALRDRNEKECKQHLLEKKEYQRILTHDTKLRNFLRLKHHVRDLGESAVQRLNRINADKYRDLTILLNAYKTSFRQILNVSTFSNMELLVQNYNEHEQRNFSCFKCITDLNHEASFWRDEIMEMQAELEGLFMARKEEDKQWKAELDAFEAELLGQNGTLDATHRKWELAQLEMAEIIHLLDGIFNISEASNASVIRLLGSHEGITPENAGMCIRVVEGRVVELMYKREELQLRKSVETNSVKQKPIVQSKQKGAKGLGGPFSPALMITGHSQDDDDGDDDDRSLCERPYEYAEMKERVLAKVAMKNLALGEPTASEIQLDEIDSALISHLGSRESVMVVPPKMLTASASSSAVPATPSANAEVPAVSPATHPEAPSDATAAQVQASLPTAAGHKEVEPPPAAAHPEAPPAPPAAQPDTPPPPPPVAQTEHPAGPRGSIIQQALDGEPEEE